MPAAFRTLTLGGCLWLALCLLGADASAQPTAPTATTEPVSETLAELDRSLDSLTNEVLNAQSETSDRLDEIDGQVTEALESEDDEFWKTYFPPIASTVAGVTGASVAAWAAVRST